MHAVNILIEPDMGMGIERNSCTRFLRLVEYPVKAVFNSPGVSVGEEYLYTLGFKHPFCGQAGGIIAVALDAHDQLVGIGKPYTLEVVLAVSEKNKCVGIFVFEKDFLHAAIAAVSIRKNDYSQPLHLPKTRKAKSLTSLF